MKSPIRSPITNLSPCFSSSVFLTDIRLVLTLQYFRRHVSCIPLFIANPINTATSIGTSLTYLTNFSIAPLHLYCSVLIARQKWKGFHIARAIKHLIRHQLTNQPFFWCTFMILTHVIITRNYPQSTWGGPGRILLCTFILFSFKLSLLPPFQIFHYYLIIETKLTHDLYLPWSHPHFISNTPFSLSNAFCIGPSFHHHQRYHIKQQR